MPFNQRFYQVWEKFQLRLWGKRILFSFDIFMTQHNWNKIQLMKTLFCHYNSSVLRLCFKFCKLHFCIWQYCHLSLVNAEKFWVFFSLNQSSLNFFKKKKVCKSEKVFKLSLPFHWTNPLSTLRSVQGL